MSVRLMGLVWQLNVDHTTQTILLALADHADDEGNRVYPSIGFLAWKTGHSERTVQRIMRQLQTLQALELRKPARQHVPREYRLRLEVLPRKAARGDITVSPLESPGVPSMIARGANGDIRGDIAVAPKPSVEPPRTESPRTTDHRSPAPRRPRKSDIALQAAKEHVSEDARTIAREAAERFGYPLTRHRLWSEATAAQQLFDAGIGPAVLRDVLARREKLPSIWKLHDWIDVRALDEISDESERDKATQKLIDEIWKKP